MLMIRLGERSSDSSPVASAFAVWQFAVCASTLDPIRAIGAILPVCRRKEKRSPSVPPLFARPADRSNRPVLRPGLSNGFARDSGKYRRELAGQSRPVSSRDECLILRN